MKTSSIFIALLSLISCQYFTSKKIAPESILDAELRSFDWSDVDAYPYFSSCDGTLAESEQRLCFETVLRTHIVQHLMDEKIVVSSAIKDTIKLYFKISEKGVLSLEKIPVDSTVLAEIPSLKKIILSSLKGLPKISPALKRGQQVKVNVTLPLILQAD